MPVSVYTDESVPVAIAAGLQWRSVAALSARDTDNLGLSDEEQLAYATAHQLVLFTHDTDFLQLARQQARSPEGHGGVIYVHQDKFTIGECIRRLKELAELFELEDFRNHVEFL
jgi:predicted nuclease of predicted toxin-antitoxin system